MTSQYLWPRYDRHFVGITWHNDIYKYTGQSDVADTIVSRHRNFLYSAQHGHNVVVKNLATAML